MIVKKGLVKISSYILCENPLITCFKYSKKSLKTT